MQPSVAVPDYQTAYSSLGSVYDPQTSLVNQEIAQLPGQQQAQQSALDQAKVNAFRDITNASNARGVLFSGVPIDEQAQYVGTKYLPAVAALKTDFTNQKFSLLDKINQINAARAGQAQGIVSDAQKAAQDAAYKNAQLQIEASKASGGSSSPLSETQIVAAIRQGLNSVKGNDGFVSPQDFAQAYKDYENAGYNPSSFYKYFQGLMNPRNGYYDYAIKKAGG